MPDRVVIEVLDDGVVVVDDPQPSIVEVSMPGPPGPPGQGVPAGGAPGTVLTKRTGTDYDAEWTVPTTGSGFAFNLKDFGAAIDTIDREDGSMTAGQPILTIPNDTEIPFTNADIGKLVVGVDGAGSAGDLKRATIIDVLSPTEAVLSKNAATTVTNARFQYGTNDTVAAQTLSDLARGKADGQTAIDRKTVLIYQPAGIMIYDGAAHGRGTGSLAHQDQGDPPFAYVGDGGLVSRILQADDYTDPLMTYQSRHGTENDAYIEAAEHRDWGHMNPGFRFNGDIFDGWQVDHLRGRGLYFSDLSGRILTLHGGHYWDLDFEADGVGDGASGNPAVLIVPNNEGGRGGPPVVGGRIRARIYGCRDFPIYGEALDHASFEVDLDGSGAFRSGIYLIDAYACRIRGTIANMADDCVTLASQGASAHNDVDIIGHGALGMTGGTGWGINAPHGPGQTQTGNRLAGLFFDNAAGGIAP